MLVGNRIGRRAGKRPFHLFSRLKVSPYELIFTVGTTKFTLGMMDDGNLHLYYTETEEIIRTWNKKSPEFVSAVIADNNKDQVVITFDILLDEDVIPHVGAFTLAGKTITNVAVSSNTFTLTVSSPFYYGDAPEVSYIAPETNALQSAIGSLVRAFTEDVSNNILIQVETTVYTEALTTALSDERVYEIDKIVRGLKEGLEITNLSDYFNWLHLYSQETSESSLINLIKRTYTHDGAPSANCVFTKDDGWQMNGVDTFINTNFNPSTQGDGVYTLNNASLFMYSLTDASELKCDMGARSGATNYTNIFSKIDTGGNSSRLHNAITSVVSGTPDSSIGLFLITRNGETINDLYGYYNKTLLATTGAGANTTSIPNLNLYLGSRNYNDSAELFTTRKYALAGACKYVSPAHLDVIYSVLVDDWL